MTTPLAPATPPPTPADPDTPPLRAIGLMVFSMAGFAVADMFIKLSSDLLPTGQIILILGLGGTLIFGGLSWRQGLALFGPDLFHPAILARMLAEVVGTLGFVTALTLTTLSMASAVSQATPLAVTLGAALLLKEPVGWRRWAAVLVGFGGVIIMLRPDGSGVNLGALSALVGVVGLSARDLVTRLVPARVPNLLVSTYGFLSLVPTGIVLLAISGGARMPEPVTLAMLGGMLLCATVAYFALTTSLRLGSMAVVAPFRYSRLIFAFGLGALVFGDRLTPSILTGATLIAGAGIYTFYREDRARRRARGAAQVG
ncbi:DMT family transporter [Oceaniglobus trochenteri]|uniref:DMT family transporter n=1 Tax=Oceaniglobus trochenteri TaxID=2763260 RepID=UPI001CFFE828|nr:DMT family transporter [Oceaniglobus trochenteri]